MPTTTQADLLVLVQKRCPTLSAADQNHVAAVALHVMSESHWAKVITPMRAVKIAAHRVNRKPSF